MELTGGQRGEKRQGARGREQTREGGARERREQIASDREGLSKNESESERGHLQIVTMRMNNNGRNYVWW